MSKIRKDKKGRKLFTGESQLADGRYKFQYKDQLGQRKAVYSWKLTESDKIPSGKYQDVSLREKEKQIQKFLNSDLIPYGGGITVLELVERYTSLKTGVKYSTKVGYKTVLNILKKDPFGLQRIDKVKLSDAKYWLVKLQQVDKRGYSSIHSIRGVLRPAFQMAVDDDLILKNPFEFQLCTVIVNDSVMREAITRKQEREFLRFVKEDTHFSRYYEGIFILFKTGLRISEFVGLTISDIDFKKKCIYITHQLIRQNNMKYVIETPKTDSGTRTIPMTKEVRDTFQTIIKNRKQVTVEPMIDGYSGFLYLDKNNRPMVAMHWQKYFQHIVQKYNRIYKVQMPKVTPHVCRHTYCSNMAKSGMSPKTLQYLMGHSDISVTLNTYTHIKYDDAEKEIKDLSKKKRMI